MAIRNSKYISWLLGLALVLLIAVPAYWYQAVSASSNIENMVASQLSNELGRHVAVGSVSIHPIGGIIARDVKVDDGGHNILVAQEVLIKYNILYIFNQKPLEGLRSVTFQNPQIYIERSDLSGEWNIIRFFKDLKRPDRTLVLDTTFRLVNGNVTVTDGKQTVSFEKVTGEFDFSGTPNLSIQLAAMLDGKPVEAKGFIHTQKGTYGLQVDAELSGSGTIAAWLPKSEVILEEGLLHTSVYLWQEQFKPMQFSGEIKLEEAALRLIKSNYHLSNITGDLLFNNKAVFIKSLAAELNGEQVSVIGNIAIDGQQPYLDVNIKATDLDIAKALPDKSIPVDGKVQIDIRTYGNLDDLRAQGTIELKAGTINDIPLENGKVKLAYQGGWLDIHDMQAEVYGGTVQVQGVVKLADTPVYSIFLQLNQVQSPKQEFTGVITASLYVTGQGTEQISTIWGGGYAQKGHLQNAPYDTIDTSFYWDKGQLQLNYFKLSLDGGWLQASGKGTKEQLEVDLNGTNLPLERFAGLMGNINISGLGNVKGKVLGSYGAPRITGSFTAISGKVLQQPFTDASGNFLLTKENIDLAEVVFTHQDTVHKMSGSIQLAPDVLLDLSINTQNARADDVIKIVNLRNHIVRGKINNNVRVKGSVHDLRIQGQAVLTQGEYKGQRIDHAKASYALQNGIWQINDTLISVGSAGLELAGTIDSDKVLNLTFAAKNILLEELDPRILPYKLGGRTELAGTITGTLDNPHIKSSIQTYGAVINGQRFGDMTGRLELLDNQLLVPELKLIEGKAQYQFAGRIDFNNPAQVQGALLVQEGQLQQLLGLLGYPIPKAQGVVSSELILSGPLVRPDAKGHLVVTQGNIKGYSVDTIYVDVDVADGIITVDNLELNQGAGFMRARGTWDMNGVIALEVGGRSLDAGFVSALLPAPPPVKGTINFTAQVSGTMQEPHAAMSVEIKQGSLANAEFDSFYVLGLLDGDILKLNQVMLIKGPHRASAYGTIPLAALSAKGRAEPNSPAAMDIRMRLEQADLSILPLLSKQVAWAAGKTHGEVRIGGNLSQPYLYGNFSVKDGTIKLKSANTPIENANIDVEFTEDLIRLNAFNGKLGGGSYTGTGEARLEGFSLTDLNFNLKLDKLYVNSKYYVGPIQGSLSLIGLGTNPILKGNLLFENVTLLPPTLWPAAENFLSDMQLDLELQADKNVRLRNSALYDMYVQGRIRAQGSLKNPITSGRLNVTRGTLQYLSTAFKITEGSADFNQYDSFLPSIRIIAEARAVDTKVRLNATGPLNQFDLRLTSEPPLSQQQIITLLTLRSRGSTAATGGEGQTGGLPQSGNKDTSGEKDDLVILLNEGLQFTFVQRIEKVVENFLGLDEFNIVRGQNEKVTDKEIYNLEVGKFLTDNFFIGYTMSASETDRDFRFRYDFTNHLSIEGGIDSKQNRRLGIEARFFF